MAKTKQTARKLDPTRQPGMESAVLEVPEQEEAAQGEAAQEEVQEGPREVVEEQAGEEVTGEQDPVDPTAQPTPSTSQAPTGSAGTGTLSVVAYTNKCQAYAKLWFEEVVQKKEVAYRELIVSLLKLVEEQGKDKDLQLGLSGFGEKEVVSVLDSIADTSGKYMGDIDRYQVEVSKEEEGIKRKRFTEAKKASATQKALDDYYDAARTLCDSQAAYMVALEKTKQTIKLPRQTVGNNKPCSDSCSTGDGDHQGAGEEAGRVSGEQMVVLEHLPDAEGWRMGRPDKERLVAAWVYFVLHRQVTGSTAVQDKCAVNFGCSVTQFKRMVTGKWQESGKGKKETTSTNIETRKRKAERLQKLAKEERGEKKVKRRKTEAIQIPDDDDDEDKD